MTEPCTQSPAISHLNDKMDRMNDKIDRYHEEVIKTRTDVAWIKGSTKLIITVLIPLIISVGLTLYKM